MTLQLDRGEWMKMCVLCGGQLLTRLHPYSMHPCQLLLLALYSDTTRIIMVLLEHEILVLNDPLRNWPYGCKGSKVPVRLPGGPCSAVYRRAVIREPTIRLP